jgi:hypothetical protein
MAIAASRVGDLAYRIRGNQRSTLTDITLDNSYPTGGEAITPSDLGLNYVETADAHIKSATGAGVNVASAFYDESTAKLLVYDETPAQVANAADLSTVVVRVRAYGY